MKLTEKEERLLKGLEDFVRLIKSDFNGLEHTERTKIEIYTALDRRFNRRINLEN